MATLRVLHTVPTCTTPASAELLVLVTGFVAICPRVQHILQGSTCVAEVATPSTVH